jgi:LuxR family transcriptional regulator, maltose regulon positive regulatory protein
MSTPVVLVSAPRGSGKTVLLAQWIRQRADTRWCWVSMSRYDSPAGFWLSLTAALRPLHPALPDPAGARLNDRDTLLDDIVPQLVNSLAAARPLTVVIDGVDVVTDPLTVESFELFVRWLPESVRVVLSTARPARGPVAALRVSGKLGEIGEADLRFTDDEAWHLLRVVGGAPVHRETAQALNARIDGWAAGLRLTALAMSSPDRLVPAVVDYLRAEVLDRVTPDERRFLSRTSVLARLTAPACAALTGPGADELLSGLAESTLLVRQRQPGTYALHPVLRAVLSTTLATQQPELARELHERAARWSRRDGAVTDTVTHAMAARRRDIALAVVLERWPSAAPQDALGWLDALRLEPHDGRLRRVTAAVRFADGATTAARRVLDVDDPADAGLLALSHLRRGDLSAAERAAERAVHTTVHDEPWCAVLGRLALGSVRLWQGRPADGYAELTAAADGARSIRYTFALVRALDAAAVCLMLLDRPGEARALATEAVRIGGETALLAGAVLARAGGSGLASQVSVLATDDPHQHAYRWWVAAELARDAGDRNASRSACARGRSMLAGTEPGGTLSCLLGTATPTKDGGTGCGNPMTERERVVLRALRGPLSLREIGDELHLSHNTVKTHVRAVFRKLGVHSRTDAVAAANGS